MKDGSAVSPEHFDLVVVGGGPGGATAATLVAKLGHRVLLLEKERFPRYQIGESLLPSTVHGVAVLLGVSDELAAAGFTIKRGGTFRWGASPEPWTFAFELSPRMAGPGSHAYQVERMKFDSILLDNARRNGVRVREDRAVVDVVHDSQRIRGVRYLEDGRQREVTARFVIDASGNQSRIHRAVGGSRRYSTFFRNLALFGYFEGGKRLPAPNSGNILCEAFDDGWFWYIPLTERLTSVGAVVRPDAIGKVQGDPERALADLIAESPLIRDYLAGARRVTSGPYGRLRVRKDYSYRNSTFWSPGMALIGDAACFVDPVFSSGVHLATYSALLAARSINSVLAGLVDEQRAFHEFQVRYLEEYDRFYEFLVAFYDMHASERSYFWQARKVTQWQSSDQEAFVDLVGGIASRERSLTTTAGELAAVVAAVRGNDEDMSPLFGSALFQRLMRESERIQQQAHGDSAGTPEQPLFAGGLVASPDGLHWMVPRA